MSIRVAAVVLRDEVGRVLTVRKLGTRLFMFPGGKPEKGETMGMCAVREAWEEVGARLGLDSLEYLGTFTTAAANEPGQTVTATVFTHPLVDVDKPSSEIAEVRWVLPSGTAGRLAPLLTEAVLPLLR